MNFVPVTEEESEKCERYINVRRIVPQSSVFPCTAIESFGRFCRKNIELIPDLYVVEVSFNKCSGTVYTTNKNRCELRGHTVKHCFMHGE